MEARSFTSQLLFVLSGLIVWSVHFLVVYPFNAIACARGFAGSEILGVDIVPLAILCVTIVALALIAAALFAATRRGSPATTGGDDSGRFLRGLTLGVGLLSAVAVILETIPALMIPPCG